MVTSSGGQAVGVLSKRNLLRAAWKRRMHVPLAGASRYSEHRRKKKRKNFLEPSKNLLIVRCILPNLLTALHIS
jgi:hypothetical protein